MSFCFVPECTSGYRSQRKSFRKLGKKMPSLFSCKIQGDIEKWNRAIPRADRSFTAKDRVCEFHFDDNSIERYFTHKFPDGSIQTLERERPLLKPGSIPTIFPHLPDRFSKKSQKRKSPLERVPAMKKIKVCESHFKSKIEREASDYDHKTNKRHSYDLNVQLEKDGVSTLFQNSRNYLSRKRFRREDLEKRHSRLENEQLQNTLQQSVKNTTENQDQSTNTVATFLVPKDILKQMNVATSNSFHNWNKNEVTALIVLYQSEECLYNKNHRHYYNRQEKNKAWIKIKNVLADMNFICTIRQIRNKIRSLCSTYASEKAYKDRCIQAGHCTEDTYAPIMWCFGLLQFLDDFIKPRAEVENKIEVTQDEKGSSLCNENRIDSYDVLDEANSRDMVTNIKISASNMFKIFSQDSEEKEDIFGEYIASEMKTLKDKPLLYIQTKQAIINVLTSANFGLFNHK